jgi:AsmA protein
MGSQPTADTSSSSAGTGVVMLPANIDFDMKADANELWYNGTRLRRFSGQLLLKNAELKIPKAGFEVAGAQVNMQGSYQPKASNNALFTAHLKADSFDVKRAYNEVPLFAEMASSAKYAEGLVSVDYQLAGRLNDQMEAVMPSIKGRGQLTLENVKLKGFKVLGAVSKATGRDSINNPNLKAVVIKSSIANNVMTIERTRMKVFGFRPRFEGQVSLDGRLNLRFRLGLPPFGIIGIPMTITGTSEAPRVRMRRGSAADELEEEPDEE